MSKLSKNEKILLGILGIAIVIYVYYTFFLTPVLNKISISNTNITNYNAEIQSIAIKEAETKKLEKQYEELKVKYDDFLTKYPNFSKAPQIAYDVKALADIYGITLENIGFSEPLKVGTSTPENKEETTTKDSNFQLFNIAANITASGTYANIKSFIKALEEEKRATEISTTSISKKEDTNILALSANFYYVMNTNNSQQNAYEFNKGTYGKVDIFK